MKALNEKNFELEHALEIQKEIRISNLEFQSQFNSQVTKSQVNFLNLNYLRRINLKISI